MFTVEFNRRMHRGLLHVRPGKDWAELNIFVLRIMHAAMKLSAWRVDCLQQAL